ncbi:MAG: hypothetical protein GX781_02200 [Clostridiales bacterium]|nr:hypothetical protein [Clostridiales bacterium]
MKKGVLTFLALVVVIGAVVSPTISAKANAPESNGIMTFSVQYSYTDAIGVNLSFNGNTAQCSGFILPSGSYNVSATLALYKQVVPGWQYLASWSGNASGGLPVSIVGEATVSNGTYKLVIRGNISNLEYPTASVTKTN